MGVGIKKITVNMPPLKSSFIKPSKFMLFLTFEMQTFLWHPLIPKCTWLSQNKSKKILRQYWENFFRNYAFFYMQGVGIFTEITVLRYTLK